MSELKLRLTDKERDEIVHKVDRGEYPVDGKDLVHDIRVLEQALASRPVREEVGEELKLLRDTMVKICKLHGIEDPIQLIGAAQNNEETFADIAVREIEKHLVSLSHPDTAERLREQLRIARTALDDRYDGADDSSTRWMAEPLNAIDEALSLLPPSKTESKGETT